MLKFTHTNQTQMPIYAITVSKYGTMVTPTIALSEEEMIAAFHMNVIICVLDSGNTEFFYKIFPELNDLFPRDEVFSPTADQLYAFLEERHLFDTMLTELNKSEHISENAECQFLYGDIAFDGELKTIEHGKPITVTTDITFSMKIFDLYCELDYKGNTYIIKCHSPSRVKSATLLAD